MKRGAKDRAGEDDGHAAKKTKLEGGGAEDEVRKHYEKGTISKVNSSTLFAFQNGFVLLTWIVAF